jgi:cysteinyl-tRNA synthetase
VLLYNSLTHTKEEFKPLHSGKVLMYVCGITPYDTTHLGHAFTYVFFDSLNLYLQFLKFKVNYTQNITDLDDDILKKAKEAKKDWEKLGEFWTKRFQKDMSYLNVSPPTNYIKATDSVEQIIEIISSLIDRRMAYEINGCVYFEIKKFKGYGKLSKFNKKQMLIISAERGGNPKDKNKKSPLDFILWQKSKKDEPFWESPWSHGRPGWHIECSAMVYKSLGKQIDIHGGGRDLIYPHHESEIAQSESFTSKSPFVKNWMHTSMVMYQGEKMSKSLGNLVLVSDLLKKYSSNALRWLLLSHYYRQPWDFSYEDLNEAQEKVEQVEKILKKEKGSKNLRTDSLYYKQIIMALDNDMNTSMALPVLFQMAEDFNLEKVNVKRKNELTTLLRFFYGLLGFEI